MDYILIINTLAALYGAYLNSIGNYQGFSIWIATNLIFIANNYWIGQYEQAFLFTCYLFLAFNGLRYSLKNKPLKATK